MLSSRMLHAMLSVMQLKIMCSFPFGRSWSNYPSFPRFHAHWLALEAVGVVLLDALALGIVPHARERLELLVVEEPADADADRIRETHREQIHREILVLREKFSRVYQSEIKFGATASAQKQNVVHFFLHGVHVELAEVVQQHPRETAVHDVQHRRFEPGLFIEGKANGDVDGEDRDRLVLVVVPVEQPDLAERGGRQNAVAVVVEENAAFGGGFGVLADFLDGRLHAVEAGIVETFELVLGVSGK